MLLAVVVIAARRRRGARTSAGRSARWAPSWPLASIVVTFLALKFFNSNAGAIDSEFNGYSTYLKHARAGFWMFVAAFLLGGHRRGDRRPAQRRPAR